MSCPGVTFSIGHTMLGDEKRECEKCHARYVMRCKPLRRGIYGEPRPENYICGAMQRKRKRRN
jgi:hypothetical protein